jgi:hypothetical protein
MLKDILACTDNPAPWSSVPACPTESELAFQAALPAIIWLVAVIAVACLNIIPARIAKSKGYSWAGFWFFGWFFFIPALMTALIMPTKPGYGQVEPSKVCPKCAESVKPEAVICRYCNSDLTA